MTCIGTLAVSVRYGHLLGVNKMIPSEKLMVGLPPAYLLEELFACRELKQ